MLKDGQKHVPLLDFLQPPIQDKKKQMYVCILKRDIKAQ